ncbi:MAG: hypothetical protein COB62_02345 [Piscirickettsiaceae bacterium]|nr:MAG: hypothetical protein COB62_02345 [Piscirickettsiaceae bacterium]
MKNLIFILLITFSGLVFASNEVAADANSQIIEINIKGMACPFCQDGLSRKLNALPAVKTVEVSLKLKKARIVLKKDQTLEEDELRQTIIDSGFTPGKMTTPE